MTRLMSLDVGSKTIGVAVTDPIDWFILFENAKFFQWFSPSGEGTDNLQARLKSVDMERAAQRLDNGLQGCLALGVFVEPQRVGGT